MAVTIALANRNIVILSTYNSVDSDHPRILSPLT